MGDMTVAETIDGKVGGEKTPDHDMTEEIYQKLCNLEASSEEHRALRKRLFFPEGDERAERNREAWLSMLDERNYGVPKREPSPPKPRVLEPFPPLEKRISGEDFEEIKKYAEDPPAAAILDQKKMLHVCEYLLECLQYSRLEALRDIIYPPLPDGKPLITLPIPKMLRTSKEKKEHPGQKAFADAAQEIYSRFIHRGELGYLANAATYLKVPIDQDAVEQAKGMEMYQGPENAERLENLENICRQYEPKSS